MLVPIAARLLVQPPIHKPHGVSREGPNHAQIDARNWVPKLAPNSLPQSPCDATPMLYSPIFGRLCPNSGGAVSQFWRCCAPILVGRCPNFRCGVPQWCPNFRCGKSSGKTNKYGQHKNWGTAPPELGHSTARIGAQHNENWGTIGARIGAQSWSTHLGHSKARIGAHMLAHIRAHTRSHNLAMIRILLREHPG